MTWAEIEWVIGWPRRVICNRIAYWFHLLLGEDVRWYSVDNLAFCGPDSLSPADKADPTRWQEIQPGLWKNMRLNQHWDC